ncbi:hypothetical protein EON83_24650 [bacterium]|nr:MAG: hypothetical protein EON83_24650 [bacterium]
MFHSGGAKVIVLGFHRNERVPSTIDGAVAINLGRTADGRFGQRIAAVLRHIVMNRPLRRAIQQADVIVARNLEMVALAAKLKAGRRLIYECLDIHRLLLGSGGHLGKMVQWVEGRLLKGVQLILTSSPRFITAYFHGMRRLETPIILVENKVLSLDEGAPSVRDQQITGRNEGPWVIGWFGMLRCRRTLEILAEFARRSEGRIAVVIAGIPSEAEFPDFVRTVADLPGVVFKGRYDASDLPRLYASVHFAWAIDYFEEGLNSTWLLPNRLYESLENGAIPIALSGVETGIWLTQKEVGVVIDDPEAEIPAYLQRLTDAEYVDLQKALKALPAEALRTEAPECRALVSAILA